MGLRRPRRALIEPAAYDARAVTRSPSFSPSIVLALACVAPAGAQDLWSPLPATAPQARTEHAAAADSARGQVVLFGGRVNGVPAGDTWLWSGSAWSSAAAAGPTARSEHAMVYDAARQRVLLFGGDDGSGLLGDTWLWDGAAWSRAATGGPPARRGHAMVFDAATNRVVLFGGEGAGGVLGDSWAWDGASWSQVSASGPAARRDAGAAYDALDGRVLLFGGRDAAGVLGDTWAWSAGAWSPVAASGPPARHSAALAFDPLRGRVVLFGGDDGSARADAWQWERSGWVARPAPGPAPRAGHSLVEDPGRRRVLLFGGAAASGALGDCWSWSCVPWCDLGFAVGGAHGEPRLSGSGTLEPGTTLLLTMQNALAGSTAVLVAGAAPLHAPLLGGVAVPVPSLVVPAPTGGVTGLPATVRGLFALPAGVPPGLTLYAQYWVLDPAGPRGFAVSNAVVGTTRRPLYDELAWTVDALLRVAASPAAAKPIYTTQDFATLTFVRNPACWTGPYDLTGLSPWNAAHANRRAGTLVSPRHVVFAKHYPLSAAPGSNDIAFVAADGTTVVRKLVAVAYPAVDIGVGVLDADVPAIIRHYPVLAPTWGSALARTGGLPMLHIDQEEKALVRDMTATGPGASYCFHTTPVDPLRQQFSETLISGDSGNPAFLLVNGEPVLVLTHHYATGGPFYTSHLGAVDAAMAQLGGGYRLRVVDLGLVPR